MKSFLKTRREWSAVEGEPEPTPKNPSDPTRQERLDLKDWKNTRDSAAGAIFLCIDESQKDLVRDCQDDPQLMWIRLKENHQQPKAGPCFSAYDALFNIRKEEGETLTNLLGRGSRMMTAIKSLRPEHYTMQQLDEELLCMALIRSLPTEYSGFIDSLFLIDKLSLTSLRAAFHNHENQAQLRDTVSTSTAAMKAVPDKTPVKCTWCSRPNHIEDNCYQKQASWLRDQEKVAAKYNEKKKNKGEKVTITEVKEESASLARLVT